MGKVSQSSVKYIIDAKLDSSGIVEKPDIVGAIFGQTEGLLGEDLDLRELQERGRIGRINVEVEKENGSSNASIEIPSSLDAADTALIAASLETIERVGPTNASIKVEEIRDERVSKRDYIRKRAKQLLQELESGSPDHGKINQEVKKEVRAGQLTEYKGFKAGPEVAESEEIVLVEGRADLLKLLKNGVKNAVAIGGTSVPEKISEVVEGKKVTAFLDGDRGGNLILEELKEKSRVDYVARAPEDREVEELGKKQIFSSLRDKEAAKYSDPETGEPDAELLENFQGILEELVGTRAAYILDSELEVEEKIPINRIEEAETESCYALAFDGEISREKVEAAESFDADYVVGMKTDGYASSSSVRLVTQEELEVEV